MNTTLIRARVEKKRARNVHAILADIGLTPGDAVNMLFAKIESLQGIPFAVQRDGATYLESEYGVTKAEADRKLGALKRGYARDKKAGRVKEVKSIGDLLE